MIMATFNSWVRCLNPNPQAYFRLFCFPYAGGAASIFRTWSNSLPPDIEVCTIQLPGREDRLKEAPFTHISPLVEILTQIIHPYLDIPFAFFGHSMGALIGFELARKLRAQQAPTPNHLFISGRRAPHIPDRNPLIHTLPEPEFLSELRQLNGTPKQVLEHYELMQLLIPILRADFSICGTYTYLTEPPLDCSISAFGGIEDSGETPELIESWSVQTSSLFSLEMLPGDHFFINSSRQLLLEMISQKIDQVRGLGLG